MSSLVITLALALALGVGAARTLHQRGVRWTWSLVGLAAAAALEPLSAPLAALVALSAALTAYLGLTAHRRDLQAGGDLAVAAHARRGPLDWLRSRPGRRELDTTAPDARGLPIGLDGRGQPAHIPFGTGAGTHTLVVGATGSGKTVTETLIAVRSVEAGHAAIVVDPKGDPALREALVAAAAAAGRPLLEWSPDGPCTYNPYAGGADTEIVDKALAAERYTEPHYLRQAQRYLGHAVRALRAAGITVSPRTLVRHMDPSELEVLSRTLDPVIAGEIWSYLDSLSARERRELAGTRDRLAVLAESDVGRWLDPDRPGARTISLEAAVRERAVVLFRLEADRRPLLAAMLGAAIVQDLLATAAAMQARPLPTVVVIDEFSALMAANVARVFARTRAAGISLVLATQELSDLRVGAGGGLLDQVLGNVAALIAHRQAVPQSAELVSAVAGERGVWVTTERTFSGLTGTAALGGGTRTRGREPLIHPDRIKRLAPGQAAVIVPEGAEPARLVAVRAAP